MTPPPPGLLSTTAVWLRFVCKPLAISRATTSLEPPGVNGTTIWMVLPGNPCATAGAAPNVNKAAHATTNAANGRTMRPHNRRARGNATGAVMLLSRTPVLRGGPVARVAAGSEETPVIMATRKMKLGLFIRPCGHHIAAWRHPLTQADARGNIQHLVAIAQIRQR